MTQNDNNSSIVVSSPIEFLIAGAAGRHDRVLVRSENCQLDIVGFVQSGDAQRRYPSSLTGVLGFLGWKSRPMQSVASDPLRRGSRSGDARESQYRFAWVGFVGSAQKDEIESLFLKLSADLEDAIQHGDKERVEWNIAPVIYRCSMADSHRRSSKRTLAIFFALYLLIAIVSVAVYVIWQVRFKY